MTAKNVSDYGEQVTARCERVLGTVIRAIGVPWRDRVCLVGGLVPRYLLPGVIDPLTEITLGIAGGCWDISRDIPGQDEAELWIPEARRARGDTLSN